MAERVVIKIDVDADTKSIDRVRRKLMELKVEAEALDDEFGGLSKRSKKLQKDLDGVGGSAGKTGNTFRKVSQDADRFGKSSGRVGSGLRRGKKELEGFDKFLKKFGSALQGIVKFGLKALLLNVGALAVSLLAVSGAFTVGRLAVKGWHMALTGAAVAGASFISVLSAIAAGQREYNAALQAYNYKFSKGQTAGTQEAMAQMRGLTSNTKLAVLGAEALNGAFAAISRSTQVTGSITAAMQAMGDFAAASADPAKSIVAAGDFLGKLMKGGKITDELITSAADVGPAFAAALEDGMKNMNIKTADQFMKALMGGQLSGAVSGQLDAVNETLFGTFKRNFQLIKEDFADMGQGVLPGFTSALERIANVISTQLIAISGSINYFTHGTLIDSLVSGFEKAAKWGAKLFNEYLPKSEGAFEKISKWWGGVVDGFEKAVEWMRPLLDGAQVLKDAFGPLFKSIFTEFGTGMQDFSKLLQENRPSLMAFGDILKRVFGEIGNVFGEFKEALVAALPVLTTIGRFFEMAFQSLAKILNGLNSLGGLGSLAALVGGGMLYGQLGKLGQAQGGTGRGGLLSRSLQAAGMSKGAMSSVANMSVMNMTVANMMGGGVGGRSPWGPPTGPRAPTNWGPPTGPMQNPYGLPGAKGPGRFAGMAGKAKGFLGGAGGGLLSMLGIGWGLGKMGENQSTGWNVAGGAATGASIGTMIAPGIGTAIGAAGGAVVGGIYDGVYGKAQRNKEGAKTIAGTISGSASEKILTQLTNYDITGAEKELAALGKRNDEIRQIVSENFDNLSQMQRVTKAITLFEQGTISKQEMDALVKAPGTFIAELESQEKELRTTVNPAIVQFNENIKNLGDATGMSKDKLSALSQEMGVDLTAPVEDFTEFLSNALGVELPNTIAGLLERRSDTFLSALDSVTQQPIKLQQAGVAVDQAGSVLTGKVASGVALTEADIADYVRAAASFELTKSYDPKTGQTNPIKAYEEMQRKLGAGGVMFQPGMLLQGQEKQFSGIMEPMLQNLWSQFAIDFGRTAIGTIQAQGMNAGVGPIVNGMPSDAALGNMTPADASKLQALATSSLQLQTAASDMTKTPAMIANGIRSGFAGIKIQVNVTGMQSATVTSPTGQITQAPADFPGHGTKPKKTPPGEVSPDTKTSRYAQTMAKHASLNSRLAGKRSITSGLRSSNLGSLGSDHLTGAAYDLTGQNLGAYQQLVKQQGGFAEFHGGTSDRHLHVVPGPSGDTPMPVAQMASAPAPVSGGDTISFVVNPSPGMDETALAKKVIGIFQREVRSARERR